MYARHGMSGLGLTDAECQASGADYYWNGTMCAPRPIPIPLGPVNWIDPLTGQPQYSGAPYAYAGDVHTIAVGTGVNDWIDAQIAAGKLNQAQHDFLEGRRFDPSYNQARLANASPAQRAWAQQHIDDTNDPFHASGITLPVAQDLAQRIATLQAQINAYAGADGLQFYQQQQQVQANYTAQQQQIVHDLQTALQSGTPYYLPGTKPPAEFQPQNLAPQQVAASPSAVPAPGSPSSGSNAGSTGAAAHADAGFPALSSLPWWIWPAAIAGTAFVFLGGSKR